MERLRRVFARFDTRDLHAYGGLFLIALGAGMAYPPLGFAIPGAALFWLATRKVG